MIPNIIFAFIVEDRVAMTGGEVGEREEVLEPGFELGTPVSLPFLTNINRYFFRDTTREFINNVYSIHCCHFYM